MGSEQNCSGGGNNKEARLLVLNESVGRIIGRGGHRIRRLMGQYDACISISDLNCSRPESILTISADMNSVLQILNEIIQAIDHVYSGNMKRSSKQSSLLNFIKPKQKKSESSTCNVNETASVSCDETFLSPSACSNTDFQKLSATHDTETSSIYSSSTDNASAELISKSDQAALCELSYPNDVGEFLNRNLTDLDRETLLKNPWIPPKTYKFPVDKDDKRHLVFQSRWMDTYNWLLYSEKLHGALCKVCVAFSCETVGKGSHQKVGYLVSQPFKKWKKAKEYFDNHQTKAYHKKCLEMADNFLSIKKGDKTNVINMISSENARQIQESKSILRSIVEAIIFCGRQELPLRGKYDSGRVFDEKSKNRNDRVFRALLRFKVNSGDTVLKNHLESGPANAQYTSPQFQNDIIKICGNNIKSEVVKKVNDSPCFSVLADETTDISRTEQMSVCVRYIDCETKVLREDFLEFVPVVNLSGRSLAETIENTLKKNGLNLENMVGQGYDGASAMSGHLNGAQAIIRQKYPRAIYVHCASHSLNLAICDSCSIKPVRNCYGVINSVCSFFRKSATRTDVLKTCIKDSLPESQCTTLIPMCETRWSTKHDAVVRFEELYKPVVKSLERLEDSINKETSQNAHQLLNSVLKPEFFLCVSICSHILSYTIQLCKYLQKVDCDLVSACDHVDSVISALQSEREDAKNKFEHIFNQSSDTVLEVGGDELVIPRLTSRQRDRNNVQADTAEEYYRKTIYIPFLDYVISHLKSRFMNHREIIVTLQKIVPNKITASLDHSEFVPCLQMYSEILPQSKMFATEFSIWKTKCLSTPESKKPANALTAYFNCEPELFPNISKLLSILATLPVSTSENERTFSTLKRIKSYLRNSSGESRLNGLAALSIHKETTVEPEEVVNAYSSQPRRFKLF